MSGRVDERTQEVRVGERAWPFELNCQDGSVSVDLGDRRFDVRPQSWRQKRILARFSHLDTRQVRERFLELAVGQAPLPAAESEREALWALACWVNAPSGERGLPLDSQLLARATLQVCRALAALPQSLDALDASDVESLWRAAGPEQRESASSPDAGHKRIVVVADDAMAPVSSAPSSPAADAHERNPEVAPRSASPSAAHAPPSRAEPAPAPVALTSQTASRASLPGAPAAPPPTPPAPSTPSTALAPSTTPAARAAASADPRRARMAPSARAASFPSAPAAAHPPDLGGRATGRPVAGFGNRFRVSLNDGHPEPAASPAVVRAGEPSATGSGGAALSQAAVSDELRAPVSHLALVHRSTHDLLPMNPLSRSSGARGPEQTAEERGARPLPPLASVASGAALARTESSSAPAPHGFAYEDLVDELAAGLDEAARELGIDVEV